MIKIPKTHGAIRKLCKKQASATQAMIWHLVKQRNAWRDLALAQAKTIQELHGRSL